MLQNPKVHDETQKSCFLPSALELMGLPMATRLVQAGFEVRGFDPDAKQVERLSAIGGGSLSDPQLFDGDAVPRRGHHAAVLAQVVREVLVERVIPSAEKSVLFIDCSTIDVGTTAELARLADVRGHSFIDAPVSGGFEMAAAGKLSFMVGGI